MADIKRMGLPKVLVVCLYFLSAVFAFNVDIKSPRILKNDEPNSYFGYSLAYHRSSKALLVGSPLSKKGPVGSGGTVFQCNYETSSCSVLARIDEITSGGEKREDQWMGANVYSDNTKILACAPRYMTSSSDGTHTWLHGKCDNLNPFDTADDFVWKPCVDYTKRQREFGYCQAGFSAKIFGSGGNNYALLSGVPNVQLNTGRLTFAKADGTSTAFASNKKLNQSDYMGYAATTGRFKSDKKTIIAVGGSPRGGSLRGRVIMYDASDKYLPVYSSVINDPSEPGQTGTYFGSALASADINNDGLDDLIVGAPYYAGTNNPNQGAAYVYINSGADTVKLVQHLFGAKEKAALFGIAIGSVGDLNRDNFGDIAVGAPYGGKDGKGVVYVYYGSGNEEPLQLKQTIHAMDVNSNLDGFGFSFAEYYPYENPIISKDSILNDIDANKFPDIAIGSHRSNNAVLLRSRPVVTIIGTLGLGNTKKIDLFDSVDICDAPDGAKYKCIPTVKICFNLASLATVTASDVEYTLDIDSEQAAGKRGFVIKDGKKMNVLKDVMNVQTKKCQDEVIYLVNNTKDIFRELVIKLSWDYKTPTTCPNDICPIANKMLPLLDDVRIPYVKGCSGDGNDVCNSDLKIDVSKRLDDGSKTIQVGITKVVYVDVVIENKLSKENAFINTLTVVYPGEITPNNVKIRDFGGTPIWDPNATRDSSKRTLTVLLTSPIRPGQKVVIEVQFGVLNVGEGTKQITLTAEALTESEEMLPEDNKADLVIPVALVANITITGNVLPEQIKWREGITDVKVVGPEVVHTFFAQNLGPSSVDTSEILINFPEKLSGEYLLNILSVDLEGTSRSGSVGTCYHGELNTLGLNTTKAGTGTNTTGTIRRRRAVEVGNIGCSGGVECREIVCKLSFLQKNAGATVIITSTLVEATFENVIKDSRVLNVYAKYTSSAVDRPENSPPDSITVGFNIISPRLTKTKEGDPVAWWIILLCILAAVLIIGIIVAVMWRRGFFKRKRAGEEEDALRNGDPDEDL